MLSTEGSSSALWARRHWGSASSAAAGAALPTPAPVPQTAPTEPKKKVAIFLDGPINDGGWGASCYKAMTDAADALGWDTAYSESVATADWATTMENYIDQGYDLIFAPGNQYTDAVKQVARTIPTPTSAS